MNKEKTQQELKEARRDLEDLKNYITQITSFLPVAICTTSAAGKIMEINDAFKKLSGYKELEIVGNSVREIFQEKEKIRGIIEKQEAKEKVENTEVTLLTKRGGKVPIKLSYRTRKDTNEETIGHFLSLIDITEKVEAEKKLKEKVETRTTELRHKINELEKTREALMNMLEDFEEERRKVEEEKKKTEAIITNFADGVLMVNNQNKIALINPKAEELLGVETKEVKNKKIKKVNEVPYFEKIFAELGKEIKAVFRKEITMNEDLILEVSAVPVVKEEKQLGILVTLHDITREKRIQKMKTEFVSVAAHQLRTPLSAIKWTLEMLLEGDVGSLTEEQKKFVIKTFKSNERMISLINDLLNVSRIEEGRYLYERKTIDVKKIIKNLIENNKEDLKRKDINLIYKKPKRKTNIIGDKEKIRLAIQNLIDNAVKYTLEGGEIIIELEEEEKNIKFSIQDDGIGISEKQHPRIFSKFFRSKTAVRRETEGSGLGLFIAKNIIEAHGGEIWFDSKEGEGSTFYFKLPLGEKEDN